MSKNVNRKQDIIDLSLVIFAIVFTSCFAFYAHHMRDTWPGLDPAPSSSAALFYGYGDQQLSYRMVGMTLQNAGDVGGRVTNFNKFDYGVVEGWLWLADKLDPNANYVPSLAAYYYGAAKEPERLRHLIDYLAHAGTVVKSDAQNEHWRWLAHAVYLARFNLKDQKLALQLANQLAAISDPDMPMWTKIMPAYIEKTIGDKKDARQLLLLMIADPHIKQEQADINQSCWYIDKYLRESDDQLDQNEIFKDFCVPSLKLMAKTEKEHKN